MTNTRTPTSRFQGVAQIARFNWTYYLIIAMALAVACPFAIFVPAPPTITALLAAAIVASAFWILASLVVSHVVYDRSELRRWSWIVPAIGSRPKRWINLHAGLDESTPVLRSLFAGSTGRVFDIFDADQMTERSIHRARRLARNEAAAELADYRHLPLPDNSCDAAMLLLSAHELRTHDARVTLFRELRRVLAPDGRIVLAEHLRDLPNFLAFGPGFLHFHSHRTWLRTTHDAGLIVENRFTITPFVAVLVLKKGVRSTYLVSSSEQGRKGVRSTYLLDKPGF